MAFECYLQLLNPYYLLFMEEFTESWGRQCILEQTRTGKNAQVVTLYKRKRTEKDFIKEIPRQARRNSKDPKTLKNLFQYELLK